MQYIYFEPKTGIVKSKPIRSNFYIYRLPKALLAKVELAIAKAGLDNAGLVYPLDFVSWLDKNDTKWNQKIDEVDPSTWKGVSDA